jgi:hypothetical protein
MSRLILILALLLGTPAQAYEFRLGDYKLLEAEHISIDWWKTDYRRDSYLPEYTGYWTEGAAFNLHLRMASILKWTNKLHMDATTTGLKHCGWQFEVRMDYFDTIQPFLRHHSQHALDQRGTGYIHTGRGFPVEDLYGLSFVFHDSTRK